MNRWLVWRAFAGLYRPGVEGAGVPGEDDEPGGRYGVSMVP